MTLDLDTLAKLANIFSFLLAIFVAFKAHEINKKITLNQNTGNNNQNLNGRDISNIELTQKNGDK